VRLIRLTLGLTLCSIGIVLTLRANIGYSPWDAFHDGVAGTTGMTIGMASIVVGIVILAIVAIMKEKLGLGTILNMILIGFQIDFLLNINLIPLADGLVIGIPMLITGMLTIGFGSYFYIGAGFGAGPRDSLMVVLMRITKKSAGICRATVECMAVVVGWLLGGMVGIGTVIAAFGIGLCVQIAFRILKFDAKAVVHESLTDTYRIIIKKSNAKR